MSRSHSITFVLPSVFDTIERMVDEAEAFFGAYITDDELAHNVLLLASEAVTNGIEHGNKLDPDKKVTVTYEVDAEHILITVEDEGEGFRRTDIPNPVDPEQLFVERGRGLFLMEHIANEIRYEDGGRKVVVVINRPKPQQS